MSRNERMRPLLSETIWQAKAESYQQRINEIFGNRYYDSFPKNYLREKIEFALFGSPPYDADQIDSKSVELINKLVSHITLKTEERGSSRTICMLYTFICLRYKNNHEIDIQVLFRLPKSSNTSKDCIFIDIACRTYDNWEDYLKNNQLPKCDMCYPKGGIYSLNNGEFLVGFSKSPACKISKSIMKGLDLTSSVVGIAATGISLAALAVPIAGPVVLGAVGTAIASSTYDIGRNVDKLVDRKKHDQCISLTDEESRQMWINVTTSTLGAASVGGRAFAQGRSAVKLGRIVIEAESMAARALKVSSVVMSGFGIMNMIINITKKFETLSINDIQQFKSSCFFFFNALISEDIVENLVSRIASLIDTKHLISFSSRNVSFSIVKSVMEFNRNSNLSILLGMVKYSMAWMFSIRLSELVSIVDRMVATAGRITMGKMSVEDSLYDLTIAFKDLWYLFEESNTTAKEKVRELFTFNREFGEQFIRSNRSSARKLCLFSLDVIEYCQVEDTDDYFMKLIFYIIYESHTCQGLGPEMIFDIANFICDKLKQHFDSGHLAYVVAEKLARRSETFDLARLNKECGIPDNVDVNCYFLLQAINECFEKYCKINYEMKTEIRSQRSISSNNIVTPPLETKDINVYLFEGPPDQETLTDNQYWCMVRDLSSSDFTSDNATIHRQGNFVSIIPENENEKKMLVFYNTINEGRVIGIFTTINMDTFSQ